MEEFPGVAHLSLVDGVVHLDEAAAVFEGMVVGWSRQQSSRLLADTTIEPRPALLRFAEFAESYPWGWASDVEDFTVALMSGSQRLAPLTIRGYHLTLRMFCDYLIDPLRVADGLPGPLRTGPDPGLPRVEHGRSPERLRGQSGPATVEL